MATIVGLYDDVNTAERVVHALFEDGFREDRVHLNTRDDHSHSSRYANDELPRQLTKDGVPRQEAELYAEGVRRGGSLVVVEAPKERVDRATALMKERGPVDMKERQAAWKEDGYTSTEARATQAEATTERRRERAPGETGTAATARGFDAYSEAFREHHRETYGNTEYGVYEPAYRFGHRFGTHDDYQSRSWDEVQPELRQKYEAQHGEGTFEDVKEAVRFGFHRPRSTSTTR